MAGVVRIRISCPQDDLLWAAYLREKEALKVKIRKEVSRLSQGRVRVENISVSRGSIEICLLVLTAVAAYPALKELLKDLTELASPLIDEICSSLDDILASIHREHYASPSGASVADFLFGGGGDGNLLRALVEPYLLPIRWLMGKFKGGK